ncbi:MAG: hypothetical protein HS129_09400 [Leptospiraceae bacterium]|nr:hypothetical protein [Leptospiraceae bacterium]
MLLFIVVVDKFDVETNADGLEQLPALYWRYEFAIEPLIPYEFTFTDDPVFALLHT